MGEDLFKFALRSSFTPRTDPWDEEFDVATV
jgi:hypothetical protein